ncbi:MAG: diacylglycerol kinase family protein, partial [Pygmaiobacter sp.]
MKHVFIVNPCAGKADASQTLVPKLIEQLAPLNLDYAIELTRYPHHATEITKQYAMAREPVRFYSCGGDGTLNEVLTGAYLYPETEVACVPLGSGNDTVRNFGTKEDFLDILDNIEGTAIPIDLMDIDGVIGVAICSVGLDAAVAYDIPKFRRLPLVGGSMAYNMAILENLCKPLGKVMSVTVDGEAMVGKYLIVAIANGSYYGGGFRAAPCARLDDGLLDVILVKKISRLRIAGVISKYQMGKHMANDVVDEALRAIVTFRRGKEITILPEETIIANI